VVVVSVSRILEHLWVVCLVGVVCHSGRQFFLAEAVPVGDAVVEPRLVVAATEHRGEGQVVCEMDVVGLRVATDRTAIAHTRVSVPALIAVRIW